MSRYSELQKIDFSDIIRVVHDNEEYDYDGIADLSGFFQRCSNAIKETISNALLQDGEGKCQHISGGLGACPKCMKPYSEINGTGLKEGGKG